MVSLASSAQNSFDDSSAGGSCRHSSNGSGVSNASSDPLDGVVCFTDLIDLDLPLCLELAAKADDTWPFNLSYMMNGRNKKYEETIVPSTVAWELISQVQHAS